MGFCNMLISKLHEQIEGPNKGKVDLVQWLNFTTFDIVVSVSSFGDGFTLSRSLPNLLLLMYPMVPTLIHLVS